MSARVQFCNPTEPTIQQRTETIRANSWEFCRALALSDTDQATAIHEAIINAAKQDQGVAWAVEEVLALAAEDQAERDHDLEHQYERDEAAQLAAESAMDWWPNDEHRVAA